MSIYGNISVFQGLGKVDFAEREEVVLFGINDTIKVDLIKYAVPYVHKTLTPTNIESDFGEGKPFEIIEKVNIYEVDTPIGKVYLTTNQWQKLISHDRTQYFGLIKPTLTDPLYIIDDEKNKNLVFVKTFKKDNETVLFYSVVGDFGNVKNGVKSNYPIDKNEENRFNNIIKEIKRGSVRYMAPQLVCPGHSTTTARHTPLKVVGSLINGYTDANLKGLGKLPPMDSDSGNAFDIDWVSLDDIFTDEKNFQNRADKYSAKSVRSIINAVDNGTFNWFAFDPITLWRNPKNDKLYILSGHSRTQAFRELSKTHPDKEVDGLNFNYIPAKIFEGSFADAKNLALNSNALGTPETLTERADYYRAQREATNKADWRTLKKQALRENNGQIIWDLSFLPDDGVSMQALKSFKADGGQDSTENFLRLATICQWIGKAYQIYNRLSNVHDQELFKFLMGGGYGSRSGQYFSFTALNDRLEKLYKQNVAKEDKTDSEGLFTEPFQIAAYKKDDAQLNLLDEQKAEVQRAEKELKAKLKEMREGGAGREQLFRIVTPLYNQWVNKQYEYWQNLDRVPKKDTRQQSMFGMFGLGRTANNELYNNNALMDCRGLKPTYKILPSYSHFFAPAEDY